MAFTHNPLKPANDTVADELAAIIKTSKIGTDKCAGMMTRELSNGERYFIQTKSAAEAEAKMRRDKLATARREGMEAERARCLAIVEPPLMHRKGNVGLWRKRRAAMADEIRNPQEKPDAR